VLFDSPAYFGFLVSGPPICCHVSGPAHSTPISSATVNLLLAHWSAFWDIRRITRVQIIRRAIRGAGDLLSVFKTLPRNPIGPEQQALAASRLTTLRRGVFQAIGPAMRERP
jgi:hypothetical protein